MKLLASRTLYPIRPQQVLTFSNSDLNKRLGSIQDEKNTTKVVVEINKEEVISSLVDTQPNSNFRSDQTYIIAGGLGGLGRVTARWMVDRGARNIILLSRSGPRTDDAVALVKELREI